MKRFRRPALVFALALLYGLVTRLHFGMKGLGDIWPIVSLAFLVLMPMGFGALTAYLGCRLCGRSRFWNYGAPVLVTCFGMLLSIVTQLEAVLCVIVAAPIMLPCAIMGGVIMRGAPRHGDGKLYVSVLALLPLAVSPLEQLWSLPHETVSITDAIEIRASPEEVWKQIASVPPIARSELPSQPIYLLDFPRPISAELDFQGVGARRRATFERDVSFFEEVTVWEPGKRLAFTIKADPDFIPHTAFDQHIIVGGRFYDVLDGAYEIQKTGTGCRLVLTSSHRLATPFNAYAGLWSRWVMNQIQGSILTVLRDRAERGQ